MALKLNIRPEIEQEMDSLLQKIPVRSKTEYINNAIREYNEKFKREMALRQLKNYFGRYSSDAHQVLSEFAHVRKNPD